MTVISKCLGLSVALMPAILLVATSTSLQAQTPEAALVLKKTDLFDEDDKVVGQADEGDVLLVFWGREISHIVAGPANTRKVASKHIAFPTQPAGKAFLEKLIAAGTKDTKHYRLRAQNHWYASDFEAYAADYTRIIELDPKNIDAYQARADAYMRLKKHEAALADLEAIVRINPKERPRILNGLIGVYKAKQAWPRVVEIYSEKLEAGEKFSDYYVAQNLTGRGFAYEAQKKWKLAEADYAAALNLNPKERQAIEGMKRLSERE